jgi:hypothetical protein
MPIRPLGGRCALQHLPKIAIGAVPCQRDLRERCGDSPLQYARGYRRAQESTCRLGLGGGYSERSASVGWIRSPCLAGPAAARPFLLQMIPERLPMHHGHHEEQGVVCFARVVEREYVRMGEARRETNLSHEALAADYSGQVGVQHLEGDVALVSKIARQIHSRHAACAERALNVIAAGEGGLK